MFKLKQVIFYILLNSSQKRTRRDLTKLVYYCDTAFFQRHATTISGQRYIHLEDCPQAFEFNACLAEMKEEGLLDVELTIFPGIAPNFSLKVGKRDYEFELNREERRIIRKVLRVFPSTVVDESKHYPNLYETYVITPVFSEIKITPQNVNTKIRFYKKKSLLSVSGKIFRVLYEE